jgi:hypothetical protein
MHAGAYVKFHMFAAWLFFLAALTRVGLPIQGSTFVVMAVSVILWLLLLVVGFLWRRHKFARKLCLLNVGQVGVMLITCIAEYIYYYQGVMGSSGRTILVIITFFAVVWFMGAQRYLKAMHIYAKEV